MIDLSKKYKIRSGRKVKLFEIYGGVIVGIVFFESTTIYPTTWDLNGRWNAGTIDGYDLVEDVEPKSVWVNVYHDEDGIMLGIKFKTKSEAISGICSNFSYIKTIEITNE